MTAAGCKYVDTLEAWEQCIAALNNAPTVAVDLEANSLYAYRERICLLQFSTRRRDYIVDPLADFPLDGLGDVLANPDIEKIFHSCEYDLILLKREFGWSVVNLFDTMWAARVLGYKNMGLAWFLREFYGVEVSKKHQKANWGKRPLGQALLDYAQTDTHYLHRLRADLAKELRKSGRYEEALEICAGQCAVRLPDASFDPERYRSVRGARDLGKRGQAVLRSLYVFRDAEASRRDLPPFKVLGNDALLRLAQERPKGKPALARIKGITPRMINLMGGGLLRAVKEGCEALPPKAPRRKKQTGDPDAAARYEVLSDWRKHSARKRGVESDVILSRGAMWEIAQQGRHTIESLAKISNFGPHRLSLHGEAILEAMAALREDSEDEMEQPA